MFTRSQKYTISGVLTLLTVATTAGIGKEDPGGVPAQLSGGGNINVFRERIFYRNGETKAVGAQEEQAASEAPVVSEPVTSDPAPAPEPIVSDPVISGEQTSSEASSEAIAAPITEETTEAPAPEVNVPRGISTGMIASGAVAAVIVIGSILVMLRMFLRRCKPTISKEAIAPPPVASTTEASLPHLEAALGIKKEDPPAA